MLDPGSLRLILRAAVLASEFVVLQAVFLGAGWWLQGLLGSGSWVFVASSVVGFAAGLLLLVRSLTRLQSEDDEPHRDGP